MPSGSSEERLQQATYLSLTGLFLGTLAIVARREDRLGHQTHIGTLEFVMLCLAAFRGGRLIAWDHVTAPLRAPFTQTVPDPSGAGETVEPKGSGPRLAIGQLLSCPICSGTWVAAALVYGLRLLPGPTRLLLAILSTTGAAELLNAIAEYQSWHAALARRQAGAPPCDTPARLPADLSPYRR